MVYSDQYAFPTIDGGFSPHIYIFFTTWKDFMIVSFRCYLGFVSFVWGFFHLLGLSFICFGSGFSLVCLGFFFVVVWVGVFGLVWGFGVISVLLLCFKQNSNKIHRKQKFNRKSVAKTSHKVRLWGSI